MPLDDIYDKKEPASVMVPKSIRTEKLVTNNIEIKDKTVNAISLDFTENSYKSLTTAKALYEALAVVKSQITAIDPNSNFFTDNTVITLPLISPKFTTGASSKWVYKNWKVVDGTSVYVAADTGTTPNSVKIPVECFTDIGYYFIIIDILRIDSGKVRMLNQADEVLATMDAYGTYAYEFVVTNTDISTVRFEAESVYPNEQVVIGSVHLHFVTDRFRKYLYRAIAAVSGGGSVTLEDLTNAILLAKLEIMTDVDTKDKVVADIIDRHQHDLNNPHDDTPEKIGAALAVHTHVPTEVGAAPTIHTHTPEECGAAPVVHTHTNLDIDAAPKNHTHTPAEVGAAPVVHTHKVEDITDIAVVTSKIDAVDASLELLNVKVADYPATKNTLELHVADVTSNPHDITPALIRAATVEHTHSQYDSIVQKLYTATADNYHTVVPCGMDTFMHTNLAMPLCIADGKSTFFLGESVSEYSVYFGTTSSNVKPKFNKVANAFCATPTKLLQKEHCPFFSATNRVLETPIHIRYQASFTHAVTAFVLRTVVLDNAVRCGRPTSFMVYVDDQLRLTVTNSGWGESKDYEVFALDPPKGLMPSQQYISSTIEFVITEVKLTTGATDQTYNNTFQFYAEFFSSPTTCFGFSTAVVTMPLLTEEGLYKSVRLTSESVKALTKAEFASVVTGIEGIRYLYLTPVDDTSFKFELSVLKPEIGYFETGVLTAPLAFKTSSVVGDTKSVTYESATDAGTVGYVVTSDLDATGDDPSEIVWSVAGSDNDMVRVHTAKNIFTSYENPTMDIDGVTKRIVHVVSRYLSIPGELTAVRAVLKYPVAATPKPVQIYPRYKSKAFCDIHRNINSGKSIPFGMISYTKAYDDVYLIAHSGVPIGVEVVCPLEEGSFVPDVSGACVATVVNPYYSSRVLVSVYSNERITVDNTVDILSITDAFIKVVAKSKTSCFVKIIRNW